MTRKRSRGGIYDRPDGKKFAQIQINGERMSRVFATRAEASEWLVAVRRLHPGTEAKNEPAPPCLASIAKEWLEARERRGIRVEQERSTFRWHIASHAIAGRPLDKVKHRHIVEWKSSLEHKKVTLTIRRSEGADAAEAKETISRQTAAHALRVMKGLFAYAKDRGLIEVNPALEVKLGRWKVGEGDKWAWLTSDEIRAVLALDHGDPTTTAERRALYATAIFAGLRKSELLHLRWSRVVLDGDRPRLEVRAPLKTPGAFRDVPLLPPAIDALRAWKEVSDGEGDAFVWTSDTGGQRNEKATTWWRDKPYWIERDGVPVRLVAPGSKSKAGITRGVRFHDLRHTFCSHLVQGTWGRPWSLYEVKEVAGHSSIQVTQRYAHLSAEGVHKAAREMRDGWAAGGEVHLPSASGRSVENANRPEK
jgi:integrase